MSETQQTPIDQNNEWTQKLELRTKIEKLVAAETNEDFKVKLEELGKRVESNFENTDLAKLRKVIKEYIQEHFTEEQKTKFLDWIHPVILAGLERALSTFTPIG